MDTETRPEEFGSSQQGLRDAANELAVERGGSSAPPEPTEIKVIDENLIKRDTDGAGEDRGLNARDVADHLSRYHEAQRQEREAFQRAIEPESEESEAPNYTPEQEDAARQLAEEAERLREIGDRAEADAAEARRHLEAHAEGVRQQAQRAAGDVEAARAALLNQLVTQYPELPVIAANPAAVEELRRNNPARFQELQTAAYQAEARFADVQRIAQAHAAESRLVEIQNQAQAIAQQQAQFSEWSEAEDAKFAARHKSLVSDAEAYAKVQRAAVEVLSELGFNQNEVAESWSGRGPAPWIRSVAGQEAILRLARQKIAEDNIRSHKGRKPLPPVVRPGSSSDRLSANEASVREAEAAMSRNPNTRNAARLLAARRGR